MKVEVGRWWRNDCRVARPEVGDAVGNAPRNNCASLVETDPDELHKLIEQLTIIVEAQLRTGPPN